MDGGGGPLPPRGEEAGLVPALSPALLAGGAAAALQHAGALKSLPGLAALPFDLTLAALAALLPAAGLLAVGRRWRLDPALAPPLLGALGLMVWLLLAACWSESRDAATGKLVKAALLGPLMLALGLVVGAERAAFRAFCAGVLLIGAAAGSAVAWGVATDRVVLGGAPGADPERVRVQYQLVGLAIAAAGGLAMLRVVEAARRRGLAARLFWAGAAALLGVAALVPGGRMALAALAAAAMLAPAVLLWLRGAARAALLWVGGFAAAGLAGLLLLLLDPEAAQGFRTLERLLGTQGGTTTAARPLLWAEALRWAGEAAPFGLGTGGFTIAAGFGEERGFHPHNHALEALAEGGLPGLALWLLAFGGAALLVARRAARPAPGRIAPERVARMAALSLPMALSVMVSTDLGNRMAWFALGLALSLAAEAVRPAAWRGA